MLKFCLYISLLFGLPALAWGQSFDLSSTTIQTGDTFRPNPPILYELAQKEIMDFSYPTMDSIARFLITKDTLMVEVGVHLDHRHSDQSCTTLDAARAKTVMQYLIDKGVDSTRLSYQGYGKTQPLISQEAINQMETNEEKEKAHQTNRRTEFVVIGIRHD